MKIDIIGAGIGGLTTAIALKKQGICVRVFEQASEIKPIGAGIILANNAMQVYKKLGLQKIIEQNGTPISSMNITNAYLKSLSKIDLNYFEKKYAVKNIAIHRGTLQQILMSALNPEDLYLGHKLTSISKNKKASILNFENGHTYDSAIIIGADGINSVVRKNLQLDKGIRKAKQICWRGISNYTLPPEFKNQLNEAWGKTARFGFVQINTDKVYWYAVKSYVKNKEELYKSQINKYLLSHHQITREIINATPLEQIHASEMSDLISIASWYKDNLCLIGDAAHAATANMGQGACQAIEDAYTITECLTKFSTPMAFEKFQEIRESKTKQIVKTSWILGKIAHLSNPLTILIRNTILKITPEFINRNQSERIFNLSKV